MLVVVLCLGFGGCLRLWFWVVVVGCMIGYRLFISYYKLLICLWVWLGLYWFFCVCLVGLFCGLVFH